MTDSYNLSKKNKFGLSLIVLSQIAPVFSIVIPFLGFPKKLEYTLITLCFVGGKHIILLAGVGISGKKGLLFVKHKFMNLLGIQEGRHAATKLQYNIGLVFIIIWFLIAIISGYIPEIMNIKFIKNYHLYIIFTSDILLIVAIFFLGGNQMMTKIGRLFKWESWELPSKKINEQKK